MEKLDTNNNLNKVEPGDVGDMKYEYGWSDPDTVGAQAQRGLSQDVVRHISAMKNEPEWMLNMRLKALTLFERKPMPSWGSDLTGIDFDNIKYFVRSTEKQANTWDDLPEDIKNTYDRLGIPEAEKQRLVAGVAAQYESEVVYHKIRDDLEEQGVIFLDTDTGLREHPELFGKYFGSVIPPGDNKFAALNTAVWSGGSFIYVPPGVHVDIPLQAYFRINTENMGQFERTLIIVDEGAYVHYVEGCLLEGERIELPTGQWCEVENIQPGQNVVGHDGKPTRVADVMKRDYEGLIHTITPLSSGNTFTVTSEHPVLAVCRDKVATRQSRGGKWKPEVGTSKLLTTTPEWVRAEELREGDFMVFPKRQPQPCEQLDESFVRLAGYFLAEGHCDTTNGCKALVFSFHIDETEYIEEVRTLTEKLWGKRGSIYTNAIKHEARITVFTNEGYDMMKEHCGNGAANKKLSPTLFNQDTNKIMTLIDAYVNGDGNRNPTPSDGQWIRCHTVSSDLAFQLQALLTRANIFATVKMSRPAQTATIQNREVQRKDLWLIQWRTNKTTGEVRDAGTHFLVPVKKITTKPFTGPVFNFETENVHSYLVKGFATHNCTAPIYSSDSLHSAVVEIVVAKDARCRYTTIQNWSGNVYNLVTKRAIAQQGATMEWVDGNIGSKVTMKYPAVWLMGEHARGETLSLAFAGEGQHQDSGAKMVHAAPHTSSAIVSKSVARSGGRTSYRGLVKVEPDAHHAASTVRCDALLVDDVSRSDTYPYVDIRTDDVAMGHEATVSKVSEDQLFYLQSRGLTEEEATAMIVRGFIEPIAKELPMEYALELNRLIELQMEGSVG